MAPIPTQIVYSGRDNTLDWQLIEDDGPLAPDRALAINRAQLITDAIVIDSDVDPDRVSGIGTDTLSWGLGHVPELAALVGQTVPARLVVFTPDWPAGLVWVDGIQVAIR